MPKWSNMGDVLGHEGRHLCLAALIGPTLAWTRRAQTGSPSQRNGDGRTSALSTFST